MADVDRIVCLFNDPLHLPEQSHHSSTAAARQKRPSQIVREKTVVTPGGQHSVIFMERVSTGGTKRETHFKRKAGGAMSEAERAEKKRRRAALFPEEQATQRMQDKARKQKVAKPQAKPVPPSQFQPQGLEHRQRQQQLSQQPQQPPSQVAAAEPDKCQQCAAAWDTGGHIPTCTMCAFGLGTEAAKSRGRARALEDLARPWPYAALLEAAEDPERQHMVVWVMDCCGARMDQKIVPSTHGMNGTETHCPACGLEWFKYLWCDSVCHIVYGNPVAQPLSYREVYFREVRAGLGAALGHDLEGD